MKKEEIKKGDVIIYRSAKGAEIEVKIDFDTVWLTQNQIAAVFGTQRPAITKHLKKIFQQKELRENSVSSILEHTANDGKKYKTKFYNLDAVISIGYRVNSKRATDFRVWATRTLKDYLVRGYAINEKRLLEARGKFEELQTTIDFLRNKSGHELLAGQEQEILNLLADYSKTLSLLLQYDEEKVPLVKHGKGKFILEYDTALSIITKARNELMQKGQASNLFGQENSERLKGILGTIYQTFDRKELYPSLEEKAAHLLYFIIKDHPFIDGNKRLGSLLFIYFLEKNNYLYKDSGERKINDNALVALALLTAVSDRTEKDKLVKVITNLLLK